MGPGWACAPPGRAARRVIITSIASILPDPGAISTEFAMLFVGWALGILSSPITDAIRRWSVKKRITRAVRTELHTLQDALAVLVLQIARHRGHLNYSLLEALMSTLKTAGHVTGVSKALKLIDDLLLTDVGTQSVNPPGTHPVAPTPEPGPARALLSLRVPGVPFLVSHLHRLDFYSHETQRQLLEIRAGTTAFEQLSDEAMQYHFMTFHDGIDREHLTALLANVAVCHERAAEKASEMVSQVAALLQNRELRPR